MGSQLVKQVFKDYKPDSTEQRKHYFNEESLAFDTLVDYIFKKLFKDMKTSTEIDWDATFPQSNIQTNGKNVDQTFVDKMMQQASNEDSITGFATGEHTIKLLQESSYATYFKIFTDQDTIDFTRLQQKKFLVLYGLFYSKHEAKTTKEQSFFEYVDKFLQTNITAENQRSIVGLSTGLRFSLAILKELYKLKSEILLSSLRHLYESLCDAPSGSLYSVDSVGFQQDAILNDARSFLIKIIQEDNQTEIVELSAKIIVRMGIVRSNPEDFLVLIDVLNKNPQLSAKIDLRDDIKALPIVNASSHQTVSGASSHQTVSGAIPQEGPRCLNDHLMKLTRQPIQRQSAGRIQPGTYLNCNGPCGQSINLLNGYYHCGNQTCDYDFCKDCGLESIPKEFREHPGAGPDWATAKRGPQAAKTDKKSVLSKVDGVLDSAFICFKADDLSNHSITNETCRFTTDGQNIYYANDTRLFKFGIPKMPNETMYIKENVEIDFAPKSSFCYLDGKLFVRKPESLETPLQVYNVQTLQLDSEATEQLQIKKTDDEINMHFQEKPDKVTGRLLGASPIFTDGVYLYLVAQKKYIRPLDADEDHQNLPTALIVEKYSATNFKHITSVTLFKNEQQDCFVNKSLGSDDEYFEKFAFSSTWNTNGENLLICYQQKRYLFDLKTGVRIQKETSSLNQPILIHDYLNGRFFMIKDNDEIAFLTDLKIEPAMKKRQTFNVTQYTSLESSINQMRSEYINGSQEKKPINIFQKLMCERQDSVTNERTPLCQNSQSFLIALLLDHIKANCEVFNNNFKKIESSATDRQINYIELFRWQGATYLTATVFRCLSDLLQRYSYLAQSEKKSATLAQQISYLNLLHILSSNFKALSYCGIQLPEIMSPESYQTFIETYNTTIVLLIERGYTKDFTGPDSHLIEQVWQQIYTECQNIMTNSMQLIYSDTSQIIANLVEVLSKPQLTTKQAENCSFSLQYLTSVPNVAKLLKSTDQNQRKQLESLLDALSTLKTTRSVQIVQQYKILETQPKENDPTQFELACDQFLECFFKQLLVMTETLNQSLAKKVTKNEKAKAKRQEDEEQFKYALILVSKTFTIMTDRLSCEIAPVQEHINLTLKSLAQEDINEDFAKKFKIYSIRIANLTVAPQQIKSLNVYLNALSLLCVDQISLCHTVTYHSIKLVTELSNLTKTLSSNQRTLIGKQAPDDSDETEPEAFTSKFLSYINELIRRMSWLVGYISFGLIQVKTVEPTIEESKKETTSQKMERMLMDSKLLSGGLENQFVSSFSIETKQKITEILQLSQDESLSKLINLPSSKSSDEDGIFSEVITVGKSVHCDLLIQVLQYSFERQVPMVNYCKQGGAEGLRLTRATFAVMAKYSQLGGKLENMVNEIDIAETSLDLGMDENDKLRELRSALKDENDFKELLKQWNLAGRMRIWIAEKKKNLSEKIEKSCRDQYIKDLAEEKKKAKQASSQEKSSEITSKIEEIAKIIRPEEIEIQIDTTRVPSVSQSLETIVVIEEGQKTQEEQADKDNEEAEEVKLTAEDKERLQKIVDVQFDKDLATIFDRIIEKAEYLLKMQVPTAYIQLSKEEPLVRMISKPSFLAEEQELISKLDWKERLKHWKTMRQDQGSIKSDSKLQKEISESGSISVLACLQSPINVKKIQQRVESEFLKASRRIAGLKMLAQLICLPISDQTTCDLSNWFTSALRDKTNKMTHYLSKITSCGNHLEKQVRLNFFSIVRSILEKIKLSRDKLHIIRLLDALKWQFWSRDHSSLMELQIFKVLRVGDGDMSHPIRLTWGQAPRNLKEKVIVSDKPNASDLTQELLGTFENLYFNLVSRIVDTDLGVSMQLKTTGTAIPALERSKSIILVSQTETLIGSAFDILFRELDRFDKILKKFEGIDFFSFARYCNKQKYYKSESKDIEDLFEKFQDEILLDLHLEKEELKKQKKSKQEKAVDEKIEAIIDEGVDKIEPPVESEKVESDDQVIQPESEIVTAEVEEKPAENLDAEEVTVNEEQKSDQDSQLAKENSQQAELEEKEKKLTEANEFTKDNTQKLADTQFKALKRLYSGAYLTRLLRMIEIFTLVAQTQTHPMAMVQRVANPFVLYTLINLVVCAQPRNQLIVLKIFQSLIHIGIPAEIFEETLQMVSQQEKQKNLIDTKSEVTFKSKFINFWYKMILEIRSAIWNSTKIMSDDSYEISQEMGKLINSVLQESKNTYSDWCEDITSTVKNALLRIQNLSQAERDVIFSLQIGADFQRISTGSQVVTSAGRLLTILGCSVDETSQVITSATYTDQNQQLIALYYDDASKDNQEIVRAIPYNVKPVYGLSQSSIELLASKSALINPEVLKHLVRLLIQATTKDDLRVQILKSITSLFPILQKQFLSLLETTELLSPIINFLLSNQTGQTKKNNAVIPITWLEQKATNIRSAALENDVSLNPENSISVQLFKNKQLIVTSRNVLLNTQFAQSAYLSSAINLHLLDQNQQYQCHPSMEELSHQRNIRHGFVFVEGNVLKTLDEKMLNLMKTSFAIVTHSIEVRQLFLEIVAKARTSVEADQNQQGELWGKILNCAVLVIAKDDFYDLRDGMVKEVQQSTDKVSEVDFLMSLLQEWGGFKTQTIMYHISQLQDKSIQSIENNLPVILQKIIEEAKANQDTEIRLKQEKQHEQLKIEILRQEQLAEERSKKIEQFYEDQGPKQLKQVVSIIDKLIEKIDVKQFEDNECDVFNLLDWKKAYLKDVDKIIDEEFVANKEPVSTQSAKSDEAMCKLYLKELNDYKLTTLSSDYKKVISVLLDSYYKNTLLEIIKNCDLEVLMQSIVNSDKSSKQLACYFKSSFNQSWLTQNQTGQKSEIKTVKGLIKRIISFCLKSEKPELKRFVHQFLLNDVIQSGFTTMKALETAKPKSVADYFAKEETAIEQLHPSFLILIVKIILECRYEKLFESKTYLLAIFSLAIAMFVRFWTTNQAESQMKLLQSCLQIVFFVQEHLDIFIENGVAIKIINIPLLTYIVRKIDFMQESFQEVQKLLLEVYLSVITLKQMAEEKLGAKLDTIIEMTVGVSKARQALKIVREKSDFQFLKYIIHQQKLQDHDRQQMNQNFGTLNPHFDVKIKAKFSIDEVERIQIKAHDGCELKPYTYLGLSQKSDGEDMKYYTQEELKDNNGVIDLNYSHFYVFYPLKRQLLLAMGEQKHNRLGDITVADAPKVVPLELVPVKVATSSFSTFLLAQDGDLYSTGEKWGASHSEFTKISMPKDEVPNKIYCGKRCKFVIAESGKVFYAGEPTQFELPNNQLVNTFKELKLSNDEANTEQIVDIACGNRYNLYVTNKGRIWAAGKQFLRRVGMDSENAIPLHLPNNEQGITVQRVWASCIRDQQMALIEVKTESGQHQLYSVGKNELGLLGQGGKIKETKQFAKVDIDFSKTQFKDISLFADHAVAIDQDGLLWAWGSNLQQRSGLSKDIDCMFQPTKVTVFEQLQLFALKVSCGKDHTLVLAKEKLTGKVKLFSIGQDDQNFKTLGTTQQLAGESVIRPIQHFNDFDIVDFSASAKFNMVILQGEKNPSDNLYEHKLNDGKIVKGVLHAYLKDNKWNFMSQEEYDQTNGSSLPDICLAFKCPVEQLELGFNGPESILNKNLEELLDSQITDAHTQTLSSITEKPIDSQTIYCAQTLINGDEVHANLSENEFLNQSTHFDVHPLIYYRLRRPLKEGAKLPQIDLKQFYQLTGKFGFKFEVTPNLAFIENRKLIEHTQTEYNEFVELAKKFPIAGDKELVQQMSRFLEKQATFDIVKDDPDKIIKVSEMTFSADGKLNKISESIIKQRILLYWHFNKSFVLAFPYLLNNPPKGFKGQKIANSSAANLFQEVKVMVLTSVKMKFVDNAIQNLPTGGDRKDVTISRNDALRFQETGKVDHTAQHTIFGQIYTQFKLSNNDFDCWKQNSIDDQALHVDFEGESSIDAGGPYRETLTNMAVEVESSVLPLMIKSPNNRNNHGDNRECFVVNQNSKTPTHQEMFKFLGVLIGYAFRSKSCMPFNYAPVFWKQLVGETLTEADLKSFDTYSWQIIQDLRKHAKTIKGQAEFESIVDQQFTTTLNCSQEIELCTGGRLKQVNQSNVEEFISLMVAARFAEGQQQIKWIQEGISKIVPKTIVNILSSEEVEIRAAGTKTTDVDKLKAITQYRNCTEQSKVVKMFWNVMSRMSEEDKTLYLKFVWGRQRLPQDCSDLAYNHRIALIDYWEQEALPESHTCFFAIDIPDYESEELLEKKLLISIRFCGEIDND